MKECKKIFLVAVEPSGDDIGRQLIEWLKSDSEIEYSIRGIGGPQMVAAGLETLFPYDELAIMGLAEVISHLPRLLARLRETKKDLQSWNPDLLLTIDGPDFNFRIGKFASLKLGIPVAHCVAPSVWAWRAGRAKKIAKFLHHLFTVLPFESRYFDAVGLSNTYIGNPIFIRHMNRPHCNSANWRRAHGIAPEAKVLCVLPGSRRIEIDTLLPIFVAAINKISAQYNIHCLFLTLPQHAEKIQAKITLPLNFPFHFPFTIISDIEQKYCALMSSDVAVAASGSVTLELMAAQVPMLVAYKANWLTAAIVKRMIKIPYISLPNIIMSQQAENNEKIGKKGVIPELLQENCNIEEISKEIQRLLFDAPYHQEQKQYLNYASDLMKTDNPKAKFLQAIHALMKVKRVYIAKET